MTGKPQWNAFVQEKANVIWEDTIKLKEHEASALCLLSLKKLQAAKSVYENVKILKEHGILWDLWCDWNDEASDLRKKTGAANDGTIS